MDGPSIYTTLPTRKKAMQFAINSGVWFSGRMRSEIKQRSQTRWTYYGMGRLAMHTNKGRRVTDLHARAGYAILTALDRFAQGIYAAGCPDQ